MRNPSGCTIDNGENLTMHLGNICNQENKFSSKLPEYSESLENLRGDEYLDPITGEFTVDDTIGSIHGGNQNESDNTLLSNEVYNKNQMLDSLSMNDDFESNSVNDNYGKMFNDYNNGFHFKYAHQQSFSGNGKYPQLNVGAISSSGSSSLSSPPNNAIMNMSSF